MERILCLLTRSDVALPQLAEACFRFTSQIALREDGAIFLEIGKSLGLFSEASLIARVHALANRFGCLPRIAVAEDAPTALAMARFGKSSREALPLEALHDYASPFRAEELVSAKVSAVIAALRRLGVEDLVGFLNLPTRSWASRFGAEGMELSLRVSRSFSGQLFVPWPMFKPAEKIVERVSLNEFSVWTPCAELEPILFVLRGLVDRAMARLRGRAEKASRIGIDFKLEKNPVEPSRRVGLELPVAQGCVVGLLPILREHLSAVFSRQPLGALVEEIVFSVEESVPGSGSQRNLLSREEEETEAWDAFLGRVCQKLGKERVFWAEVVDRYLPERAWQPVLSRNASKAIASEAIAEPLAPSRPLRLLRKPRRLVLWNAEFLKAEGVSESWRVKAWHGPERLSIEWWQNSGFRGFNRDYYRVETGSGEQLWVFRVLGTNEAYLHGYFD